MNTDSSHIALIGCGNMGGALLRGWLRGGITARYSLVEPHGLPQDLRTEKSITVSDEADERLKTCDVVVLAVKPQAMDTVCSSLKPFISEKSLILSIAAGRSIGGFERIFGNAQPIIRTMPNLPASIGKGMTVAVSNKKVTATQHALAQKLLECAGRVEWLQDEKLIDAATAINGNGPAYVFYLIETLAQAGVKAGLDERAAMTLARQTIIGGAALAEARPETDAASLRKSVTSPGGTTEAALKILMNGEMQKLFDAAIEAGKKRSKDLSS